MTIGFQKLTVHFDGANKTKKCQICQQNIISFNVHSLNLKTKPCQPILNNQTISSFSSSVLLLVNHSNIRSHSHDPHSKVLDPCEERLQIFLYRV